MGMLDKIENQAVDTLAKVGPWAGPIPTAYSIGRAGLVHFGWPWPVALALALAVEVLGIASVSTALMLRGYNVTRRKTDPAAPFALAVALVVGYLVTATALVVFVDVWPGLVTYAPALLPLLSMGAAVVLGLRADHAHRLQAIDADKAERRAERQASRQSPRQPEMAQPSSQVSKTAILDANLARLQAGRKAKLDARLDSLEAFYLDNPQAGIADAARAVGVSRQTVYGYLDRLEEMGRIARGNGDGIQVLTREVRP